MRPFVLGLGFSLALTAFVSADAEDILLKKFQQQKQLDVERLRAYVDETVARAKDLKPTEPERGVELLRDAAARMDGNRLLSYQDRKTMNESIVGMIAELRESVLLKKREKACDRLDDFRIYLESVAPDMRYPGRSGDDHWEPAVFTGPAGQGQTGKLLSIGTGVVGLRYGREERNVPVHLLPWIQVFGGFYVYDLSIAHHMFLSNREFYERIFLPSAKEFLALDTRTAAAVKRAAFEKAVKDDLLKKGVDSGVFFLRGLENLPAIPGVGDDESGFYEYAAQRVLQKGLPMPIDRIYPRDLVDTFTVFSQAQKSAIHRAMFLLRSKGVATSKLYAEILREETSSLVRSEYPNFHEVEMNRVLFYAFDKLR